MEYCFLNCAYVTQNDETQVYEVVRSEDTFTNVRMMWLDLKQLQELAKEQDVVRDFSFDSGFLKCANIARVRISDDILKAYKNHTIKTDLTEFPEGTILTMLKQGVENDFCFVSDELVNLDRYVGEKVTPFSKVKFSQSSMSIYYSEVADGTIQNKYVVRSKGRIFEFEPFYFIVPEECEESVYGKFIKHIQVNNRNYNLFYAENASLIERIKMLPMALVNKAVCLRCRVSSAVKVLECLCKPYRDESLTWVGNNHAEHSLSMIEFISSYRGITSARDAQEIIDVVKELQQPTFDETKRAIYRYNQDIVFRFAAQWAANIIQSSVTTADLINNCQEGIRQLSITIFYIDLFLYRIRSFSFKTNNELLRYSKNQFFGSNEPGFTLIREVIK